MCSPTEDSIKKLVNGVSSVCEKGGFDLVKIASNSRDLLKTVPEEKRAKGFKDPDGELGKVSVLGLSYSPTICMSVWTENRVGDLCLIN